MSNHRTYVTGYPVTPDAQTYATRYPVTPDALHAVGGYPYAGRPYLRHLVVVGVSFLVVILTIVWLALHPRVPEFRINSLSLSEFNLSSSPSTVSGNWTAFFSVGNRNSKLHVYYDQIDAKVYYRSDLLTSIRLFPFDQPTKSQINISATLVATSVDVDDWVVSGFKRDTSRGTVKFNFYITAMVHFNSGRWWTRRRNLRISCDDVPVDLPSNNAVETYTGGPKKCG